MTDSSPSKKVTGPPFTVDRYGTFADCVIAERDWLRMAERLNVETVARLQQERDEWERNCRSLKIGYDSMFDKACELERRLAQPPTACECKNTLPKITEEVVDLLWGSSLIESDGPGEPWGWSQNAVDFACLLNEGLIARRDAPTKEAAPYVGNPCICIERLALQANPDCPIHGMEPAHETPATLCGGWIMNGWLEEKCARPKGHKGICLPMQVQACRPEDRAILATDAGQEMIRQAQELLGDPRVGVSLPHETPATHEHTFERMPGTPLGYACECGESPPVGWYPESEPASPK